jgi:hypothetical protein
MWEAVRAVLDTSPTHGIVCGGRVRPSRLLVGSRTGSIAINARGSGCRVRTGTSVPNRPSTRKSRVAPLHLFQRCDEPFCHEGLDEPLYTCSSPGKMAATAKADTILLSP